LFYNPNKDCIIDVAGPLRSAIALCRHSRKQLRTNVSAPSTDAE